MFWLNAGINDDITFDEWDKYVVVIQEKLLLVRWKRNLMRSWSSWFRDKCAGKNHDPVIKGNEIVEIKPEVWKWLKGGLKRYKRNAFVRGTYFKDREAGRDCIVRALGITWWDWCEGSRPFFWRCPEEHYLSARDGRKNFVREGLPSNSVPQSVVGAEFKERVRKNLSSILRKGYVVVEKTVISLTHFFL